MYENEQNGIGQSWLFLISDIIAVEISLIMAFYFARLFNGSEIGTYSVLGIYVVFLIPFIAFIIENYKGIFYRGYFQEFKKTVRLISNLFIVMITIFFAFKITDNYSRILITAWFIISIIVTYIVRVKIKPHFKAQTKQKSFKKLVAVVDDSHLEKDREIFINTIDDHYSVCKIIEAEYSNNFETILSQILDYCLRNPVDEIIFYTDGTEDYRYTKLINELLSMGITVHLNVSKPSDIKSKFKLSNIEDIELITFFNHSISDRNLFLKRVIDIVGSIVGLILTFIISIFIVPAIVFTSPGPIIFTQKRVGKNGRIFNFYKFRSMYADAEERKKELMKQNEMDGLMFKIKDDPRITPIGKFIRKTSIDELPQFWNVLKGDMSLVGTRPPTLDEYILYEPHHKARLSMKPGITGMWQASGRSNIRDFEEIVKLDTEYIYNWSIGLDFKLMFKTIQQVFKKEGSM